MCNLKHLLQKTFYNVKAFIQKCSFYIVEKYENFLTIVSIPTLLIFVLFFLIICFITNCMLILPVKCFCCGWFYYSALFFISLALSIINFFIIIELMKEIVINTFQDLIKKTTEEKKEITKKEEHKK